MFRCMVSLATDGINICIITSGKCIYVTRKMRLIIYISKFLIRCLEKNDDYFISLEFRVRILEF